MFNKYLNDAKNLLGLPPEEREMYQSDIKRMRTRRLVADESRENEVHLRGR